MLANDVLSAPKRSPLVPRAADLSCDEMVDALDLYAREFWELVEYTPDRTPYKCHHAGPLFVGSYASTN